ncbi:MAG: T9SS type A sorting domain-containing protein [Flavobacteriales bacterium]|nr:T9SS type A sorting domain-containing protein [Flavobacteriales bacterium]
MYTQFNKYILIIPVYLILNCVSTAQNYPLPGATWYFDCGGLGTLSCIEKWTYLGDSLGADGRYLKIHSETKHRYFIADTITGFNQYSGTIYLLERNDSLYTLSYINSVAGPGNLIADFNVSQGDSTLSPYYESSVAAYMSGQTSCSEEDSLLIYQKSTVISTDEQTISGTSLKSYRVNFFNQSGGLSEKEFNQRSIVADGQYYSIIEPVLDEFCGAIYCFGVPYLICFRDDFSGPEKCADKAAQFNLLSNQDVSQILPVSVFPNPFKENVFLSFTESTDFHAVLYDLRGSRILSASGLGAYSASIDTYHLKPGLYVLRVSDNQGKTFSAKLIKE